MRLLTTSAPAAPPRPSREPDDGNWQPSRELTAALARLLRALAREHDAARPSQAPVAGGGR